MQPMYALPALGALLFAGIHMQGCEVNAQGNPGRRVDCNQGNQSLAQAVSTAPPGSTIRVEGLCDEAIVITTDGLVLEGLGDAVLDGTGIDSADPQFNAMVTIDGARGVTLRSLTVQNGPAEGILARRAATFSLEDVTVERNGYTGIVVSESSTATLRDVTSTENAIGMDVFGHSLVVAHGEISVSGNAGSGLEMNAGALFELRGANLVANRNLGAGVVAGNSQIAVLGFERSQGSSITANENGGCGIFLPTSKLSILGGQFFGSAANRVEVHGNAECGIHLPLAGYIESPFATALFSVENNPVGIRFGENSGAAIIGGLAVQSNDTGLLADGAGAIVLVSVPPSPHNLTGNGTDVDLQFGSRVTFAGPPFVGSVSCDATALARGSASCP